MTPVTVTPGEAVSEPVMRPAAQLAVGDRIADKWLPLYHAADVLFVAPYRRGRTDWVLVAYRYPDGSLDSSHFLADALIPLEAVADFTGLTYTRTDSEPDDPTPVSPARVPPHTGSVVDGDVLITDGACD